MTVSQVYSEAATGTDRLRETLDVGWVTPDGVVLRL
jgi:hypothetical protein